MIHSARIPSYFLAIFTVLVVFIATLLLEPILLPIPLALFFAGVAITSWYGGLGPALLAIFLSAILIGVFFLNTTSGATVQPVEVAQLIVYILVAFLVSTLRVAASIETQKHLERSEIRLNSILQAVDDSVTVQNTDGNFVYANEAAAHFFGMDSIDQLLATPAADLETYFDVYDIDGNLVPTDALPGRQVLSGIHDKAEDVLRFRLRKTEEERWYLLRAHSITDTEWDGLYVVNVARDITKLKQVGAEVDQERQHLKRLLAHVPGVVWEALGAPDSSEQQINFVNDYVETMLGYQVSEWLSTPNFWLKLVHPSDRKCAAAEARAIYQSKEKQGISEFRWVKKGGRAIWVEAQSTVVVDERGNSIGMRGIALDISERKRGEDRQRFLAEAGEILASSLDYQETLSNVARMTVSHIADWCAIDMLVKNQLERVSVAHVDPSKVVLAQELYDRYPPDLTTDFGVAWVLRTGQPEIAYAIEEGMLKQAAQDTEHYQIIKELGLTSAIIIPLKSRNQILGVLTLLSAESGRIFDDEDFKLAKELARRASLAVDNARLYQQAKQGGIEEERQRIAHELHDAISQTLFSASMITDMLPRLWNQDPNMVYERLPQLHKLIQGAVAEMRTLLLELRPGDLQKTDFSMLLEHLAKATAGQTTMNLQTKFDYTPPLPADVQLNLYRIAQEALNNILKHSRASQAQIILHNLSGELVLEIRDNGRGFDPNVVSSSRFGLAIMRERARDIGAAFQLVSRQGNGTQLTITWSMRSGESDERNSSDSRHDRRRS